jgi:hypothetical protein
MPLITRQENGGPLTIEQLDENFLYLESISGGGSGSGTSGTSGVSGPTGPNGATGPNGVQGPTGPSGSGTSGTSGVSGPTGPSGSGGGTPSLNSVLTVGSTASISDSLIITSSNEIVLKATNNFIIGAGGVDYYVPNNIADGFYQIASMNDLPVSGWYAPTLTPITNINSVTSGTCTYIRIGGIVSCKVSFSIDATTASIPTVFHVTFPIPTLGINNSTIGSGIAIESFGGTTSTSFLCQQETTTNFACFFFPPTTNMYNGVVDIQYQGV